METLIEQSQLKPKKLPVPQAAQRLPSLHPPGSQVFGVPEAPLVFNYQDYRKFLKDWFIWKKTLTPEYSGAMFAKRAGIHSHTLLGMVIRGDRNISYDTIRGFCKSLALRTREKLYFEKLVLFNQAKSTEDRADFFEELVSLSQGAGKTLITKIQDHARYLAHWYGVVVRELVLLDDFKPEPEWISQKLKRKITKKEALETWEMLLSLGLVKQNAATGRFEQVDEAMDIDPGQIDFAIRNFHKEFLKRAASAIDEESMEDRELSSLTLSLTDEGVKSLREKIKEFRKHVNLLYCGAIDGSKKPKHVVAVNMQLLVLTDGVNPPKTTKNKKHEERENEESR